MKVLSLFDGISCGRLALKRAGLSVTSYDASEIDKHAIAISKANWTDINHLGDVTKVKGGYYDLLIGGSPCQGFSFAGKQLNFNDSRSVLFFEYVRILNECRGKNPHIYFLLENVNMKQEYQDIISKYLGVQPIKINSSLLSAQNRVRLYWTNIPNVTQPEDKEIVLADILEEGVVNKDKSYCLDASYYKGGNLEQYFKKSRRQLVFKDSDILAANIIGRKTINGKRSDFSSTPRKQRMEIGGDKASCLTTATKDTMVYQNGICRILTPIECERLQTLPDNYTNFVSKSQRYKALGNGWTVDVIAHILKNIPQSAVERFKPLQQELNKIQEEYYKQIRPYAEPLTWEQIVKAINETFYDR